MLPETVAELSKHKNIVGIKDATGDLTRLKQTKSLVSDDFLFLVVMMNLVVISCARAATA